jgi:hypothetical protein
MKVLDYLTVLSLAGLCAPAIILGCATTPVVKPTCVISWDRSADWRIDEY